VKNLGIDWKLGEAYFASKLLDFDLASNNGNWQWVAGTGSDAAPYFRVFNPETQQKKFDPNFVYCKRWLHEMDELGNYSIKKIANLKSTRLEAIERYKAIDR
jgi:deoxyribodipyrimidine photo-lyase